MTKCWWKSLICDVIINSWNTRTHTHIFACVDLVISLEDCLCHKETVLSILMKSCFCMDNGWLWQMNNFMWLKGIWKNRNWQGLKWQVRDWFGYWHLQIWKYSFVHFWSKGLREMWGWNMKSCFVLNNGNTSEIV